ncbi:MAG: SRPBCC domain-containing protein [bacterium]
MTAPFSGDHSPRFLHYLGCWLLVILAVACCPNPTPAETAPAGDRIDTSLFVASGSELRTLVKEALVAGTPAEVFAAWTTEAGILSFLEVESNIDLRIGGPMELYFGPDLPEGQKGSESCQILSYVPDRMLSFSWNGPPLFPEERSKRSWVVIFFDEMPSGRTKVQLQHLGFGTGGRWDDVYEYFDNAWGKVLEWLHNYFREQSAE